MKKAKKVDPHSPFAALRGLHENLQRHGVIDAVVCERHALITFAPGLAWWKGV